MSFLLWRIKEKNLKKSLDKVIFTTFFKFNLFRLNNEFCITNVSVIRAKKKKKRTDEFDFLNPLNIFVKTIL